MWQFLTQQQITNPQSFRQTAAPPTCLPLEHADVCVCLSCTSAFLFCSCRLGLFSSLRSADEAHPTSPRRIHAFEKYLLNSNRTAKACSQLQPQASLCETQVPKSESECAWPSLIHSVTRIAGSREPGVAATASPVDAAAALKGWGHRRGGHHRQRGGVLLTASPEDLLGQRAAAAAAVVLRRRPRLSNM